MYSGRVPSDWLYRHPADKRDAWEAQEVFLRSLNGQAPEVAQDLLNEPLQYFRKTGIHKIDSPRIPHLGGRPYSVDLWDNFRKGHFSCEFPGHGHAPCFVHHACAQRNKIESANAKRNAARIPFGWEPDNSFPSCPQMVGFWHSLEAWGHRHNLVETTEADKWILGSAFRTLCDFGIRCEQVELDNSFFAVEPHCFSGKLDEQNLRILKIIDAKSAEAWRQKLIKSEVAKPHSLNRLRKEFGLLPSYILDWGEAIDATPEVEPDLPPTGLATAFTISVQWLAENDKVVPHDRPQWIETDIFWCPPQEDRDSFLERIEKNVHDQLRNVPLYKNTNWTQKAVRSALDQAEEYCNAVEKQYLDHGWRKPKPKRELSKHIKWAIRFQLKGETYTDIADSAGVEHTTVKRGIEHILTLVGLVKRPDGGPGRKPGRRNTIAERVRRSLAR